MEAATHAPTLVNFFQSQALIVHFALFRIAQNFVCLAALLELFLGLLPLFLCGAGVLVGVPLDRVFSVSLLYLIIVGVFCNSQNSVVVFPLRFFKLYLSMLHLLTETWRLRVQRFHFVKVANSFIKPFLRQKDLTALQVGLCVVRIQFQYL